MAGTCFLAVVAVLVIMTEVASEAGTQNLQEASSNGAIPIAGGRAANLHTDNARSIGALATIPTASLPFCNYLV